MGATGPEGPQGSTSYDAGTVGGLTSGQLLRSDIGGAISGSLTVNGHVYATGYVYVNTDNSGDAGLFSRMRTAVVQTVFWDGTTVRTHSLLKRMTAAFIRLDWSMTEAHRVKQTIRLAQWCLLLTGPLTRP